MSTSARSDRISIHAPAKGATQWCTSACQGRKFQSTLPRRERLPCGNARSFVRRISIHAPAKGATVLSISTPGVSPISIHAPAKGATMPALISFHLPPRFQSTLPRRERHYYHRSRADRFLHFNPRSREGSDHKLFSECRHCFIISIHAPAKGATHSEPALYLLRLISIHAPAKGATPCATPSSP